MRERESYDIIATEMKELSKIVKDKKCLVFLDLEGTQLTHEMIEIGAYKVILKPDCTVKKIHKPYHAYVLPKHHVGPIVTKLTGITDLQLKREGIPYRVVLEQLKGYLGKDFYHALFVSYGTEDAHIFLQSSENNMDASTEDSRFIARRFFDLADYIGQFVRGADGNMLSLKNILNHYGVDFEGTQHNAQADAYNLILLYKAFLEKPEIAKQGYANALAHARFPQPVKQIITRLNEGKTVTPEEWKDLISEAVL